MIGSYADEVLSRGPLKKMMYYLKYDGSDTTRKEEASEALACYNELTTVGQKQEFLANFFHEERGNGGKNLKFVVEMYKSIQATQDTEIAATETFLYRRYPM